jgi:hypothetical protein
MVDGELVHQSANKAATSFVEDGLSPMLALVFRREAPSGRHGKKVLSHSVNRHNAVAPASILPLLVFEPSL